MTEKRILVVESRQNIRDVLIDLVQQEGMIGIGVDTGSEAFNRAHQHRPDLMIVSLSLWGEMDGIDLLIATRRDTALAPVPAVLLVDNIGGNELSQVRDENLLIMKMADLDHLAFAMHCLLMLSIHHDDPVSPAAV